jgi:hypothetical protein
MGPHRETGEQTHALKLLTRVVSEAGSEPNDPLLSWPIEANMLTEECSEARRPVSLRAI